MKKPAQGAHKQTVCNPEVQRNEAVIEQTKARQGWRVQVTNLPAARWSLREAVLLYNGGWSVERDFHLLKDQPLGIQPLFVREDEQIVGLTRLLTIALRVLTLSELQVRSGLAEADEKLIGLYEGQPKRTTEYPTATRCLKAISRMEITATRVEAGQDVQWHVTDLPPLLKRIMKLLHLSPALYTRLHQGCGLKAYQRCSLLSGRGNNFFPQSRYAKDGLIRGRCLRFERG